MSLLKRVANRARDYLLFNPALERHWLARMRGRVTSLLYHQVQAPHLDDFLVRGGSPAIDPVVFRAELEFLRERGVRFLTFGELAAGDYPSPRECGVAVCFDDCFLNNYTKGLAVLEEVGVKATFFQTTAMIDAHTLIWEHRLYWHTRDEHRAEAFRQLAAARLGEPGRAASTSTRGIVEYLREYAGYEECKGLLQEADAVLSSPSELASVARRIYPAAGDLRRAKDLGHEIGSHGHEHLKRANIEEAQFERDLQESHETLLRVTGSKPHCYSYPFDSHFPGDAAIVLKRFQLAATVSKRTFDSTADPMWLPRFTWPGVARNSFRRRRWLLTGTI